MINQIFATSRITAYEGFRHRILFGVFTLSLLTIMLSTLLCGIFMRDLYKVMMDINLSVTSFIGILIPVFLTITLVSSDIHNKTIYTILSKPISRSSYLIGKFLGTTFIIAIVIFILTGATLLSIVLAQSIYPPYMFQTISISKIVFSAFACFFSLTILNSCVIFWSCVTTSSFLTTMLTLATYIIGHTLEDIVRFITLNGENVDISPLLAFITKLSLYIFPNLSIYDLKYSAIFNISLTTSNVVFMIIYGTSYIVIMLFLSILIFRQKDLF